MRLNAYLARAGVASRRKADELIKTGRVTVNGEPGQLNTFVEKRDRVELDGGRTAPARAKRLAPSRIELEIHEGKKHQVKRMLAAVGHPVVRLHRGRYAGLTLKGLGPGESRELTGAEVERLRSPRAS